MRLPAWRWTGCSATNVPRPGIRWTMPSWTSRATALRAVIRLTPNSSHSSASEGSGSPGASLATRAPQRLLDLVVARDEAIGRRAHASIAQVAGRCSGTPRRPVSIARQMPAPEVGGDHGVELRAGEADVRRRGEQRPLRVLGDDLDAAVAAEVVDPVGPVAGDEHPAVGGEREAVENGAVEAMDELGAPVACRSIRESRGSNDSTTHSQRPSGETASPFVKQGTSRESTDASPSAESRMSDPSSRAHVPESSSVERPVRAERRVVRLRARPGLRRPRAVPAHDERRRARQHSARRPRPSTASPSTNPGRVRDLSTQRALSGSTR